MSLAAMSGLAYSAAARNRGSPGNRREMSGPGMSGVRPMRCPGRAWPYSARVRTSPWLREILALDPERDAQRIVRIDTLYEFPFDTTRSLEFALFRTFGSPAVSRLLDETQEFA